MTEILAIGYVCWYAGGAGVGGVSTERGTAHDDTGLSCTPELRQKDVGVNPYLLFH